MESTTLDDIDHRILELLAENARRSTQDIAQRVGLSASPVKRRIDRLESSGLIRGYTTITDPAVLGDTDEAFAQLRFGGNTPVDEISSSVRQIPEVTDVYTIAGDPDALVHFRVRSLRHLQSLIDQLRQDPNVIGTKTLIVLGSWSRGATGATPVDTSR